MMYLILTKLRQLLHWGPLFTLFIIGTITLNDEWATLRFYLFSRMMYLILTKLRQLLHWGPLFTLFIIGTITLTGLHCSLMWWPVTAPGGILHLTLYFTWLSLILYNYFSAAFVGPGFVPRGWQPEIVEHRRQLQFCNECRGFKAPRAHHCRKCHKCVMKMDHHCPWINTCCGHRNHAFFTYFLFFAPLGCSHAAVILICSLYRSLHVHYYIWRGIDVPLVYLNIFTFVLTMFSIGLALGVSISVGMLFYIQIKSIAKNETGIESWIVTKAFSRRDGLNETFTYPYNLGWRRNLREVLPLSGYPRCDGFLTWPVVKGCDQFTLSREQLAQKNDKRERAVCYSIIEPYSGAFCTACKGCRVLCNTPLSDDPRIKVSVGDCVFVTRWKSHWLYGDKLRTARGQVEERGWFPRRCAIQWAKQQNGHCEVTSNHGTGAHTDDGQHMSRDNSGDGEHMSRDNSGDGEHMSRDNSGDGEHMSRDNSGDGEHMSRDNSGDGEHMSRDNSGDGEHMSRDNSGDGQHIPHVDDHDRLHTSHDHSHDGQHISHDHNNESSVYIQDGPHIPQESNTIFRGDDSTVRPHMNDTVGPSQTHVNDTSLSQHNSHNKVIKTD